MTPRWLENAAWATGWLWPLRVLDRVAPRYGYGGHPSPRVTTATPAEAERIEGILRRKR